MSITLKYIASILFFFIFLSALTYLPLNVVNSTDTMEAAEIQELEENDEMLVSFIPLEMGEATLIQLANNDFYLIDTGCEETAENLVDFLQKRGVTELKGIFLTNPSKEHMGGFTAIMNKLPVDTVYIPSLIADTFPSSSLKPFHIEVRKLKANDRLSLSTNVKVIVLSPLEPLSLSPQANSMVFQLINGDIHFLFTSDINGEIEKRLVEQYNLKSEILKVSDFGSNAGSTQEFLEEVDAQVATIFTSNPDLYRLSEDVLERLNESWADVFILEQFGGIEISSNGKDYQLGHIKTDE